MRARTELRQWFVDRERIVSNADGTSSVIRAGGDAGGGTATDAALNAYLRTQLLQPGEKIIWTGRPNPGRAMLLGKLQTAYGAFFLIFTTIWAGAVWGGFSADLSNFAGIGIIFVLVPIYFYAVSLWMLSTPLRNWRKARRTRYAVTEQRVIILRQGWRIRTNIFTPASITDYEQIEKIGGHGDIRLRKTQMGGGYFMGFSSSLSDGLWGISDVPGAAAAIAAMRTG